MAITESDTTVGQIVNEVGSKLNLVSDDAQQWGEAVADALDQTPGSAAPTPADPNVSLPGPPSGLAFANPIAVPVRPNVAFSDPDRPTPYVPANVVRYAPPNDLTYGVDFADIFTTYEPGAKPVLPTYTAPTVTVPDLVEMPAIVPPDAISLGAVAPVFRGFNLPSLAISINPSTLPALANTFDFVEDPFSPQLLAEITARAREVLGGTGFLPRAFWDDTWSQGVERIKREELAALRQATREHAAAGWMMPGAVGMARQAAARQKGNEAVSDLTRDLNQKQVALAHEDMFKAQEIGIQCEQILLQANTQANDRALRRAVEANNAGITVYNAAVQAYQVTELQAKDLLSKLKDLELRGELAELQAFEVELKAAGFLLEIDKNQVELYKAQWAGEETKARAYAAYADALKAYVQGQAAAVDAFGKQVESNNTILQGWAIEWDAYIKRFKPAEIRIQAHEAKSGHFGRLVQKLGVLSQSESARVTSDIAVEGLGLQKAGQSIEKYKALWQGIQTRLDALTKVYGTDTQAYQAGGTTEAARVQALTGVYDTEVKKASVALQGAVAGLTNRLGYWSQWMQSWTSWNTAAAGAYAQLGGSAYSAMNYSLGADGSTSYQNSYGKRDDTQTNYNYDMTS